MMKLIMVFRNFANSSKNEPNNWKDKTTCAKDKRHSPRKLYYFELGKLDCNISRILTSGEFLEVILVLLFNSENMYLISLLQEESHS
jgi:hypothetical protein